MSTLHERCGMTCGIKMLPRDIESTYEPLKFVWILSSNFCSIVCGNPSSTVWRISSEFQNSLFNQNVLCKFERTLIGLKYFAWLFKKIISVWNSKLLKSTFYALCPMSLWHKQSQKDIFRQINLMIAKIIRIYHVKVEAFSRFSPENHVKLLEFLSL